MPIEFDDIALRITDSHSFSLHASLGCEQYYWFDYDGCMGTTGSAPSPSSTGNWYPDWSGSNTGCVADGNEPIYMTLDPSLWMYDTLSECCEL